LDELAGTPAFRRFLESEFPNLPADGYTGPSRRDLFRIMGASLALAGVTGCRWPRETIVPYAERPPGRTPGRAVRYSTAMELDGVATGLLVTSYDGRPIKVEGNDRHPFSLGSSSAWAQAAILELYDPDRSQREMHQADRVAGGRRSGSPAGEHSTRPPDFASWAAAHFAELKQRQGAGLCVLAEPCSSPTLAEVRAGFLKAFPQTRWFEYCPLSRDNEREGTRLAFGRPLRPQFKLAELEDGSDSGRPAAQVIVCFDADLLMTHPAALRYTREFARGRTAEDGGRTMNRLYVVEAALSLTGSNADHRYAVRSSEIGRVMYLLAAELAGLGLTIPLRPESGEGGDTYPFVKKIAADLAAHKGRSLIAVGPQQPPEVHALACLLNNALGNIGGPVTYTPDPDPDRQNHLDAIAALVGRMNDGSVNTLVILGGNPVYDAPADLDFAGALGKVATSIHLSEYDNETSQRCTWHLPRAHFLESWGDALAWDGTYTVIQPLIEPLYGGRTPAELLALLAGDPVQRGYELVRRTFQARFAGGDLESRWRSALHDGLVEGSAWPGETPKIVATAWPAVAERLATGRPADGGLEVFFCPDYKLYDGRFANNGWLQELPDPLTKLTWDNAALLAPATAAELGIRRYGEMVRIELDGRRLTLAAYILPGQARGTIGLPLGYGRGRAAGDVAAGAGFNTYALRTRESFYVGRGAKVRATGERYRLASTQDHHAIQSEVGRREVQKRLAALFREGTLAQYREYLAHKSEHGQDHGPGHNFALLASEHTVHPLPLVQPFASHEFPDKPRWALAIDLTRCTGCAACVVACQAENNIPVVGKEEVYLGREMHWIRIDRYFRGDPDDPTVAHQPVTCHQCENAPCEQVCPVAATVHDSEGLNVMVYNRCIGTRYCSNNCPYKVRRFNWFYNHHGPRHPRSLARGSVGFPRPAQPSMLPQAKYTEIQKLGMNPEVTVRSRGVMEKCTFCVQRIMAAKIAARNAAVSPRPFEEAEPRIADGVIVPACAQACPAEAIVFGDLRDGESRVSRWHAHERAYAMLEELNVRPRLKYLTRLRNPFEPRAAEHGPAAERMGTERTGTERAG
jgi:molybdopterin-containing oxidoreductase family iron-sulfur binding subunit